MRIAAIYWRTSSVGGVNSKLTYLRRAALRTGDSFDVLISDRINRPPQVFPEPHTIRGGDSYITIHGEAPHGPKVLAKTIEFLHKNYDGLFFSFPCPHPNERYGYEPLFEPLFYDVKLPKVSAVGDGYWHTYAEWGRKVLPHVRAVLVDCEAYAAPLRNEGHLNDNIKIFPQPFDPSVEYNAKCRSKTRLTVWVNQWKMIKGIHKFLPVVENIPGRVELYNCGIQYYQLRNGEYWREKFKLGNYWDRAVGKDYFGGIHGSGKAEYYGWKPLDTTMGALMRSWFSVNLQGITAKKPKESLFGSYTANADSIYAQGSYNYSEVESLYYGAIPVLHSQVRRSAIPQELYLSVDNAEEVPKAIASTGVSSLARTALAQEWVHEVHGADKLYAILRDQLS